MEEKPKPSESGTSAGSNTNLHAIILWVVGFIVLIAGIAVATVKGTHLRGSGLGTILMVVGVVAVFIGFLRFYYHKQ